MKIGIISDIHLDLNKSFPIQELLCEEAGRRGLDGLLLAGDIADGAQTALSMLEQLKKRLAVPLWFVPGNHDMWDPEHRFKNAWQIYDEYRAREGCLCGGPIRLGDAVLVGNIGWYDYSLGSERYRPEDFMKKSRGGRVWQDSLFVNWEMDDRLLSLKMRKELEELLTENEGRTRIAVTHMIAFPSLAVPEERPNWDYFNAFLGSRELGALYGRLHVEHAVMGHVHYRRAFQEQGVDCRCACLGYHTEWKTQDAAAEIAEAMQEIVL